MFFMFALLHTIALAARVDIYDAMKKSIENTHVWMSSASPMCSMIFDTNSSELICNISEFDGWHVRSVIDMLRVFKGALNQDIDSWDVRLCHRHVSMSIAISTSPSIIGM